MRRGRGQWSLPDGRDPIVRAVELGGYRATSPRVHPTHDLVEQAYRAGRYHEARSPQPFYAAATEEGVWAEVEKHATAPVASVRMTHVRVSANLLDALSRDGLAALAITRRDLTRKGTRRCIELAQLAREVGSQGLLVPSAALSGGTNVVIWRGEVPHTVEIISSEIVHRDGGGGPYQTRRCRLSRWR